MSVGNPWKWTRRFAVGLTVSVAAFSAFGALAPHIPMAKDWAPIAAGMLLACFYGNAQGLDNCMAANGRLAWERRGNGNYVPAIFFFGCFGGFALLSMSGLHSAWEYVRAHATDESALPADWLMKTLFVFVAFSEPAMNYGVQALKSLHKAEEREEEAEARRIAADAETRQREAEERRKGFHAVSTGVAAAALAAAIPAADFPLEPISHSAPASADAEAHASHGWSGPRDQAKWELFKEAVRRGLSPMEIHEDTGIPTTTVYNWLKRVNGNGANSHAA
jgi:hypothetical protein